MRRVACVFLLLLLGGCSWYRRAHARLHPDAGVRTAAQGQQYDPQGFVPHAPERGVHVVRARDARTADGHDLAPGALVPTFVWIAVAPGGELVLDWTTDLRVEIDGGSLVRLGTERPFELLVAFGGARGMLAPAPNAARPPLHIATPLYAVEVPGDGDVYVASQEGFTRECVFVLGGAVELRDGTRREDERPTTTTVVAGDALVGGQTVRGVATIDAARGRAHEILSPMGPPRPATLDAALALVDEDVSALAAEDARRRRVLAGAVPPQGSAEGRARVVELVGIGQRMLWKRIALLAAWEIAEAAGGTLPADVAAALGQRAERVRPLLGPAD